MDNRNPPSSLSSSSSTSIIQPLVCEKSHIGLSKLLDDLLKLSNDRDTADIVFIIGNNDRDEERIYAHKIIFMARCKSFQAVKKGEICRIPGSSVTPVPIGQVTPIRLLNVKSNVFRQFVIYIYTGKISFEDSTVFEMMTLAQDMGDDDLRTSCEEHVISTLSIANAYTLLTAATEIQKKTSGAKWTDKFMQLCISCIGENGNESVKTMPFLSLSKDALIKLISSDYFYLKEEDVWRCVLEWAKHQAGVTQPTSYWNDEERTRVCKHLSGVIEHVRLLLIDSQVFAEEVEPTGAVSMELSLERYRLAALQTSGSNNGCTGTNNGTSRLGNGSTKGNSNNNGGGAGGTSGNINGGNLSENDKRLQPRFTFNLFQGSVILKNDKLHFQRVLNNWYGVPKQHWTLIYRASTHGYSAHAFHEHCDNIAPTFVIAMDNRGNISGGFSDVAWAQQENRRHYTHSERAFLYTLGVNGGKPTKYDVIKKTYAICYHSEFGPIYGAGADLLISDNCNSNEKSYSNLSHSYSGPISNTRSLFQTYNFRITEYEVYTLADPEPEQQDHN